MSIPLFGQVAGKTHVITPHSVEKLSTLDKCVLLILADGQRQAGDWFVITSDQLAAFCAATRKGVLESVARLEKWGVIAVKRFEKRGTGHMNRYRVLAQDLIYREAPRVGHLRLHLNVTSGDQQMSPQVTPYQVLTKSFPPAAVPSPFIPLSKEQSSGRSARPDKGARAGGKNTAVDQEEVEAIEGLVMAKFPHVDARYSPGLAHDCRQENREITTEQMLLIVTKALLEPMPKDARKPLGVIRTRVLMAARKSHLAALDQAAEKSLRKMRDKRP